MIRWFLPKYTCSCRGQRLHYCILIFPWDFWEHVIAEWPSSAERTQVHALVQGHIEYGVVTDLDSSVILMWVPARRYNITSLYQARGEICSAPRDREHVCHSACALEPELVRFREGPSGLQTWYIILHLHSLSSAFHCYTELSFGPTIRSQLAALYDTLLQQNLLRIVEPYSVYHVEIDYVAKQVGQGRQDVEAKCVLNCLCEKWLILCFRLSQMILDKVLHGVLDQGRLGCLIVFDELEADLCPLFSLISFMLILFSEHVWCSNWDPGTS